MYTNLFDVNRIVIYDDKYCNEAIIVAPNKTYKFYLFDNDGKLLDKIPESINVTYGSPDGFITSYKELPQYDKGIITIPDNSNKLLVTGSLSSLAKYKIMLCEVAEIKEYHDFGAYFDVTKVKKPYNYLFKDEYKNENFNRK